MKILKFGELSCVMVEQDYYKTSIEQLNSCFGHGLPLNKVGFLFGNFSINFISALLNTTAYANFTMPGFDSYHFLSFNTKTVYLYSHGSSYMFENIKKYNKGYGIVVVTSHKNSIKKFESHYFINAFSEEKALVILNDSTKLIKYV